MIQQIINSFRYAFKGLSAVWREERNFRIEIFVAVIVMFLITYFKFSFEEITVCVVAITIVLGAEVLNTAVEDICNKIEPKHDLVIGKIKDIMGGFVLVTVFGSIVISLLVIYHHFSL